MPSLDSVTFDDTGFALQGDMDGSRVWHSTSGGGIGLFFFDRPPDITATLEAVDDVREFYRRSATAAGLGVIEIDTLNVDGCLAVRTIFKAPQKPMGMTYVGSITLPFRDFSYVLKAQCSEQGMTGTREAVVLDAMIQSGNINLDGLPRGTISGWNQDPYDPAINAPVMRNLSEDEQYDAQFPDHPLSRVRSILKLVQPSLRLAPELKSAPPFVFSGQRESLPGQPMKKPWWKRW